MLRIKIPDKIDKYQVLFIMFLKEKVNRVIHVQLLVLNIKIVFIFNH